MGFRLNNAGKLLLDAATGKAKVCDCCCTTSGYALRGCCSNEQVWYSDQDLLSKVGSTVLYIGACYTVETACLDGVDSGRIRSITTADLTDVADCNDASCPSSCCIGCRVLDFSAETVAHITFSFTYSGSNCHCLNTPTSGDVYLPLNGGDIDRVFFEWDANECSSPYTCAGTSYSIVYELAVACLNERVSLSILRVPISRCGDAPSGVGATSNVTLNDDTDSCGSLGTLITANACGTPADIIVNSFTVEFLYNDCGGCGAAP